MRYLLVVDRDGNERFTMSMLLQRFGYTVASTSSASEAIDFLCVAPADAVFVEAGETGDDLTERLQGDARFKGSRLSWSPNHRTVPLRRGCGRMSLPVCFGNP